VAFIEEIGDDDATGAAAELFAADRAEGGYVRNDSRVLAHRPKIAEAWAGLAGSVKKTMDPRRYELATLAAARRLRSSYCMLAHAEIVREKFLAEDALRAIVRDQRSADLDRTDVAVMDFAEKIVADATSITQQDIDRLRELGLTDGEIFEVAATAAARCFYSKLLDSLGVQADAVYLDVFDPELREVLAVGRPIEGAG
jgi:uncharacterized peroxidase-related enzyme